MWGAHPLGSPSPAVSSLPLLQWLVLRLQASGTTHLPLFVDKSERVHLCGTGPQGHQLPAAPTLPEEMSFRCGLPQRDSRGRVSGASSQGRTWPHLGSPPVPAPPCPAPLVLPCQLPWSMAKQLSRPLDRSHVTLRDQGLGTFKASW